MISLHEVSKSYTSGEETVEALRDIDLGIGRNEFVSVVGPSGCGKSTFLHLIAGLIEPSEGRITVDEEDIQSPDFEKSNMGLVFQQPVLLEWRSVFKNVMLPIQIMHGNGALDEDMDFYRTRGQDLIELVGLEGFEDRYPQELSGGMQQRVSICQSLIYDPEVLLMDEPFGSLDALTKDQLNEELLNIWQETKKTIVFVTHDLEEAVFLSDRVLVMSPRPGRIIDDKRIALERPRDNDIRGTEEFISLTSDIYEYF